MKKVIMVAHPFPPEGAATSYRTLRFVRQLPKLGWNATVISALPSQYERYDPKLLAMVPSETEVIRVKGYDLWQSFQSWRFRRIQRKQSGIRRGQHKQSMTGNPAICEPGQRDGPHSRGLVVSPGHGNALD